MLSYFYLFIVFISCFSYYFKDHCLSLFLGFLAAFELDVRFSVGRIKKRAQGLPRLWEMRGKNRLLSLDGKLALISMDFGESDECCE